MVDFSYVIATKSGAVENPPRVCIVSPHFAFLPFFFFAAACCSSPGGVSGNVTRRTVESAHVAANTIFPSTFSHTANAVAAVPNCISTYVNTSGNGFLSSNSTSVSSKLAEYTGSAEAAGSSEEESSIMTESEAAGALGVPFAGHFGTANLRPPRHRTRTPDSYA